MTEPVPQPADPEIVSAILRSDDTGPDALYPTRIGVFCDGCGLVEEGEYLVSDRMDQRERFEIAPKRLRAIGWSCDEHGDLCPNCRPTAADTSPADELRTAAEKLRRLATAASIDNDGTPTAHWNSEIQGHGRSLLCGDYTTNGRKEQIGWPSLVRGGSFQRPVYMHAQHAEYAAAMGPTVGLALAAWLESLTGIDINEHGPLPDEYQHALAVAHAINQEQQQ